VFSVHSPGVGRGQRLAGSPKELAGVLSKLECRQGRPCRSRTRQGSKGHRHGREVCTCKAGPSRIQRRSVAPNDSDGDRVLRRGVESPVWTKWRRFTAGRAGPCTTGSRLWEGGRGQRRAGPLKGRAEVVKVSEREGQRCRSHSRQWSGEPPTPAVTVAESVRVKPGRAVHRSVAWDQVARMP
jgi:hypothetical protein